VNGSLSPRIFVPLAKLLSESPAEPDWIWPGYVAPGSITLLAGRPKVGKSTLLFALMAAIDGGSTFCGRRLRTVPIVLLSEERRSTITEKARVRSWTAEGVSILLHHTAYALAWADIVRHASTHVGSAGLVVVDTLADFAGLGADAENNAGAIQSAMRPLLEIAGDGCAVLVVSHQRKAAGEHGEAVRGSNALTAAVDIVVELERAPGSIGDHGRVLKAMSRYSATPDDLVVRRTDHEYEAIGELASATAASELQRVVTRLAELGEVTAQDLAEAAGLSKGTAQRRLADLLSGGRVVRSGNGNKGDPYRWRLASDPTSRNPYGPIKSGDGRDEQATTKFDSIQLSVESDPESNRNLEAPPIQRSGADDPMLAALHDVAQSDPRWLPGSGA